MSSNICFKFLKSIFSYEIVFLFQKMTLSHVLAVVHSSQKWMMVLVIIWLALCVVLSFVGFAWRKYQIFIIWGKLKPPPPPKKTFPCFLFFLQPAWTIVFLLFIKMISGVLRFLFLLSHKGFKFQVKYIFLLAKKKFWSYN